MKRRRFLTEGLFGAAALLGAASWAALDHKAPVTVSWRKVKQPVIPEPCHLEGDVAVPIPNPPAHLGGAVAPPQPR